MRSAHERAIIFFVIDDELREAERALTERGDPAARAHYAAQLRRLGRIEALIDVVHHELPVEVRAIAKALAVSHAGRTLLIGPGQYGDRVGVLDVATATLVHDSHLPATLVPGLRAATAEGATVWPGELDFMYATPWKYAWTVAPAPFRLLSDAGAVAHVEGGTFFIDRHALPAASVASVDLWLANGWVDRGVSLILRSGERVDVAQDRDLFVSADPTYDGINLMCDTSWVHSLGRSLAAALGVPCSVAEDLK